MKWYDYYSRGQHLGRTFQPTAEHARLAGAQATRGEVTVSETPVHYLTREERDQIRKDAQHPEAQDGRHTYRWSEHGIEVHAKSGEWKGFYALRHCLGQGDAPTRLLLHGISFGNPLGEVVVSFITLGDICKWITDDHPGDPKYNLQPVRDDPMSADAAAQTLEAQRRAVFLSS